MSVAGYLGANTREWRFPLEEANAEVETEQIEAYESVEDYDPVLRSHCRLDVA